MLFHGVVTFCSLLVAALPFAKRADHEKTPLSRNFRPKPAREASLIFASLVLRALGLDEFQLLNVVEEQDGTTSKVHVADQLGPASVPCAAPRTL